MTTPSPGRSASLDAPPADDQLKGRVRAGASYVALSQIVGQGLQVAILAALYRLLRPADFGLFWLTMPVLLVLRSVGTLGLNIATVQQADLSAAQLSTVFWLTLAGGAVTAAVMLVLAPGLSIFYDQPSILPVALALSAIPLVTAAGAQHQALLERRLRLAPLAVARLASQLVAGAVAIALAWRGAGVWALVAQWYLDAGVLAALCWYLESWRPGRLATGKSFRQLVRFGGWYTVASLLFALAQNLDKVLLGWALPPEAARVAVGYYSQAFNWMMKPVYLLSTPLASVLIPALSRAAPDRQVYADVLLGFTRIVAAVWIPAGVGLAIVAPDAMLLLGGPEWAEAGRLLRWLAIAITVQGFVNMAGSILASVGRADRLAWAALAMVVALAGAFATGLQWGRAQGDPAAGLAGAYTLAMLALFVPYMTYTLSATPLEPARWFAVLVPIAWPTAVMGVAVLLLQRVLQATGWGVEITLPLEVAAGVVTFALLARGQLVWLAGQLRRLAGSREAKTPFI